MVKQRVIKRGTVKVIECTVKGCKELGVPDAVGYIVEKHYGAVSKSQIRLTRAEFVDLGIFINRH